MQSGEYIINRLLPGLLREVCDELGLHYRTFSDDWVIEITHLGRTRRVIGYKFDNNSAVAANIAQDKAAAYEVLSAHGVPALPHYLVREAAGNFTMPSLLSGGDIVVKPLMGTGGRGVRRFATVSQAEQYMTETSGEAWAVSPYYAIEREVRIIVLDDSPLLTYEKVVNEEHDGVKYFNLGRGATVRDFTAEDGLLQLATAAVDTLGLRVAAVDCVQLGSGEWLVMEVNDGIMMEYYGRISPKHRQRAIEVYRHIVAAMMAR